ncbi:hypothetical protein EOL96_00555 [Candidatus Saccharibacteria bacterium]|nr:hypothetical protein [Candidatus Saccharibacteria bacterium]
MVRSPNESPAQLGTVRDQIDHIDEQIVNLLNKRLVLALAASSTKLIEGLPVFDDAREQEVLAHVYAINDGPLPDDELMGLYLGLMRVSRQIQNAKRENPESPIGKTQPTVDWYVPAIDDGAVRARLAASE